MRIVWLLLVLFAFPLHAETNAKFDAWLTGFKREALAKGIRQDVLDDAFADIHAPSDAIIRNDHTQPEKTKSFDEYAHNLVTAKKVAAAKEQWQSHRELFTRIEATYGVPPEILLALWGVESGFGEHQGNFSIIPSLTTLAWDGRRSAFFRKQLLDALQILQREHMHAEDLTGSWAGAMGQIQFMPSSYLAYAVDFDGDGKADIWTDEADALASMANYLHSKGWNSDYGWGMQVWLPNPHQFDWDKVRQEMTLTQWKQYDLRYADGSALPQSGFTARLVLPDNQPGYAFLVFTNYDVLMDWNHSTYFATAIGMLADAIARP